jgi:ABC-type sugar transport system ATPase subunit
MADGTAALEIRDIDKWFGSNHANRKVSMTIRRGSIHGVIGENGAGKSTIMNIVYGYLRPDGGSIAVNGRVIDIRTPWDAISNGIGMVHQHFMLVDNFTVLENVLLGVEGGPLLLAQRRAHLLGRDARHDVVAATGRVGHDQRDRPARVFALRPTGRCPRQGQSISQQEQAPSARRHALLSSIPLRILVSGERVTVAHSA